MKASTLLLSLLFIFFAAICAADTLFLKSGRVVKADSVWEQDNHYMYRAYGATVGIPKNEVSRVEYSQKEEAKQNSFQFDVWPLGVTVRDAFDIAQRYDLPLHKQGSITVNKRYHPQVRKYPNATRFYYNTNLLGHFARVELFFTPLSKQLHTVQIQWPNQQPKDSPLVKEIISTISGKYGKYRNTAKGVRRWVISGGNQIHQRASFNTVYLNYLHSKLIQAAKDESKYIKEEQVQIGAAKDKGKF